MTDSRRVTPLERSAVAEFEDVFRSFEDDTGTLPNNLLVMARRPALLRARAAMAAARSLTVGCRYCQAHRTSAMLRRGTEEEKL